MMKHAWIASGLAAVTVVAGLGVSLPANATAAASTTGLFGCNNKIEVRPATYTPDCGDNGFGLEKMHWTSWTSRGATGHGTVYENDNYPNHATGRIYQVPALIKLWGSASVKGHPGERAYTEITATYPGARPAVYKLVHGKWSATYPRTQTFPLS